MRNSILIVDDSLTVRMDLANAFQSAGFKPIPCACAEDARRVLLQEPVDLIVLDVLLPDGDGIELIAEFRSSSNAEHAPILLLSSEADVQDRIRGLTTGADEYVGKPYDRAYVVSRSRELLRRQTVAADPQIQRILIIDDSATYREALRNAIELHGYQVELADNGETGLRMAADLRPHAVIVDSVLPGESGTTIIRRIRLDAALRHTPCILLTASGERDTELQALDAGADAFVQKQDDCSLVLARLAAILRSVVMQTESQDMASLLGPKRLLAVDDSITYLNELADEMRKDGYEVILARSGLEALDLLSVQQVDCILLDLLMPGISGQETCKRIKSAPAIRDTPLIMLTALEDRDAMLEGLSVGADDYISKSSDFRVLKARVQAQIRRRQFEDENRKIRERLLRAELEAAEARAEREIAKTRAALIGELERKNRELEAFSYSVSHDLRAPLRAIGGFSRILLEDYADSLDEEGRRCIDRITSGVDRMAQLIADLLELSKVGRMQLSREPVNLSEVAAAVIDELRLGDPNRIVDIRIEDGIEAIADRRLIRVVFDNLLGNAWKFTAKTENACIEFGTVEYNGLRAFRLKDNGAGFNMENAGKLFAPFQRLHSESEFKGTGIGLATVQRIVDRHGGEVWAESEVGRGAAFYWTLPAETDFSLAAILAGALAPDSA